MDRKNTNVEMVKRMHKKQIVLKIKKEKLLDMEHVMKRQKYQILQDSVQAEIQGKRSAGRRKN